MNAGQTLKQHRTAAGLSQQKLAERIGMSVPIVSKWERGTNPPSREAAERVDAALSADGALLLAFGYVTQLDDDERPATRRELADLVTAVDLLRAVVDQMQAQWQGAVDDAVAEVERRAHPRARPSSGGQS